MGRKATERKRKSPGPSARSWLMGLFSHWQQHGLANQTMDDWAVAVGKSKATLYAYFSAKEEMVEAALALKLQQLQAFEGPLMDKSLTYHDRYRMGLEVISPHLGEISVRFLADLKEEFPEQRLLVDQFLGYAGQVLAGFYQEGMDAGAFRATNIAMLVQMDQLFFQQLTDPEFLNQAQLHLKNALEHYIELKFGGLLVR